MTYRPFAGYQVIDCMVGAGVGFRVLPSDVRKLPPLRTGVAIFHAPYLPVDRDMRQEYTTTNIHEGTLHIHVGDSKAGWVGSLKAYIEGLQNPDVHLIAFDYNSVRPKGEPLKTFGGRASGPEALREMFDHLHMIIATHPDANFPWIRMRPIDCMDWANIIGYNVVCGGVRRTAQLCLFSPTDHEILNAKMGLWEEGGANYGKFWRSMSNNSIFFEAKPTKEYLHMVFERIRHNGEPALINAEAARRRRPRFEGVNPCAEILLDDKGVCLQRAA